MVKFALQLKANLENITKLRPVGDDFRWFLKLKCGNCAEVSDKWQYITLMDSVPLKGGRGSASMVQKCKLCSRENSIDILRTSLQPYNFRSWFWHKKNTCKICSKSALCEQGLIDKFERSINQLFMKGKTLPAENSERFKTIVEFECRGLEPVDFQPQAGFAAEGAETGTPFNDINLQEKDWTDYDEKAKESVGIYEVTHQFKKC